MATKEELVATVVENYFYDHDDFYDALGTLVDDINLYLRNKPLCTNKNELLLINDVLEEVEKLNQAVGL